MASSRSVLSRELPASPRPHPGLPATRQSGVAGLLALFLVVSPSPSAAQTRQPPPAFRSGVELVEVPVLVRDRDGRLIGDLTRDEFRLFEDGRAQEIVLFERVAVPIVAAPPAHGAVPVDVASNDVVQDARVFVLVLDALHVAAQNAPAVQRFARQFLEQHVGPSDLVAVVAPGAESAATQDFTTDRARLIAAIERFAGRKLRSATVERDEQTRRAGGDMLYGGRDPSDHERASNVSSLVSVLQALSTHLSRIERRRKSLLLFSEGIDYNTADFGGFTRGIQRHAAEVVATIERGIAALVGASVAVYSIDPRRLSSAEGGNVEAPIHQAVPGGALNAPGVAGEYAASIQSLRHLAESTGGFAAVDSNDLTAAFDRILRETSEYYVLAYAPAKPVRRGEVRRLEVRVARDDVRVVARKEYSGRAVRARDVTVTTEATGSSPFGAPVLAGRGRGIEAVVAQAAVTTPPRGVPPELGALLASPLPRPGLPIRVYAVPFAGDSRTPRVTLVVEVAGGSLRFVERDGRFHERLDLALLTVDDRARAGNGSSTRLELQLTAEEFARARTTGVRWQTILPLAPGRHQVRVAGRAAGSGAAGLTTLDVDVPRFERERLSMSGIALTSLPAALMITRGDAKALVKLPTPLAASRSYVTGDRVTALVEVSAPPDVAAVVSVRVSGRDRPGGQSLSGRQRVPAGRREEVAFAFDTAALGPGRYVLDVTAGRSAGEDGITRSVAFEIVPK